MHLKIRIVCTHVNICPYICICVHKHNLDENKDVKEKRNSIWLLIIGSSLVDRCILGRLLRMASLE